MAKRITVSLKLPEDIWKAFKKYAALRDLKLGDAVAEALSKTMKETPIPNSPIIIEVKFEQLLSAKQLVALQKLDRTMDKILRGEYLPKPVRLDILAEECGLLDKKRAEKLLKCYEILRQYYEGR